MERRNGSSEDSLDPRRQRRNKERATRPFLVILSLLLSPPLYLMCSVTTSYLRYSCPTPPRPLPSSKSASSVTSFSREPSSSLVNRPFIFPRERCLFRHMCFLLIFVLSPFFFYMCNYIQASASSAYYPLSL